MPKFCTDKECIQNTCEAIQDHKFCFLCGKVLVEKLRSRCPSCAYDTLTFHAYCPRCGQKLKEEA